MTISRRRRAAVAVLAATVVMLGSSPAIARGDNRSEKAKVIARFKVPKDWVAISGIVLDASNNRMPYSVKARTEGDLQVREITTAAMSSTLSCEAYVSPAPTYSWSNHRMFWGHNIICNQVVSLRLRSSLWSGPDLTQWQDSTSFKYGIGSSVSEDLSRSCLDWSGFTYWRMFGYHEIDRGTWVQFVPYPGTHPPRWQECLDIS